jgi:hypothetical protein
MQNKILTTSFFGDLRTGFFHRFFGFCFREDMITVNTMFFSLSHFFHQYLPCPLSAAFDAVSLTDSLPSDRVSLADSLSSVYKNFARLHTQILHGIKSLLSYRVLYQPPGGFYAWLIPFL